MKLWEIKFVLLLLRDCEGRAKKREWETKKKTTDKKDTHNE